MGRLRINNNKKKILFITGSRGEWGYIRPILKIIKKRGDLDYVLVVTNMHLLSSYGNSYREIEKDGFKIHHKVNVSLDGYTHYTMVKSLGIFMSSLPDIVENEKPDWIIISGDRGEQMVGAMVGGYTYTPVAHIQAGELSGNIDGMTRHAIGKYAHIHLAANKDAAQRLIKLGEESFRVFNVGAPQLDELRNCQYSEMNELEKKYSIDLSSNGYILVVMHPITEEYTKVDNQIKIVFESLNSFNIPKILIMPNNDAGSLNVRDGINKYKNGEYHVFTNLSRKEYLGFLKNTKCIFGNSSSGLLEAPTFKIPAVNIGRRQHMRMRGVNVIDVDYDYNRIVNGINKAMSKKFRDFLNKKCINPYGDGKSAERIIEILLSTKIDDKLLIKNITY
ncbi:MAG: UDP-N-acetylglucosamine 2-epimerase [Smithella sp.]|jgi:GDP/UDP-N,N'-diacetylbacillosamine 2-epimerase (hydrolysing)